MMDIIVIWPRSHDYPLFRSFLEFYNDVYNKVIFSFTGENSFNVEQFLIGTLPRNRYMLKCEFVDGKTNDGNIDWRNYAVNKALEKVESEWVLFLEPDFFIKDRSFFDTLLAYMKYKYPMGFFESNRLHPACLLVTRDLINKTRRDFSVDHNRQLDHFGLFTEDLKKVTDIATFDDMKLLHGKDWYHMQGVTHNYNLVRDGNLSPIFKRDEFFTYNDFSLKANVAQMMPFMSLMKKVEKDLFGCKMIEKLYPFFRPLI
ncbi:MAG: hypothetical protein M1445_12505 [Bacteroidetes bacterium]|nr:hypothetical protein [Bacteroidota bacterium]